MNIHTLACREFHDSDRGRFKHYQVWHRLVRVRLSTHMQTLIVLAGPPQAVTVSFVTHFTDHINVAMDIELILFLHAFVTAYISYKDKGNENIHQNCIALR